ncbi:MAG: glycosyl hydrolase family 28-related protein, partial [Verrucomicrobiia bacterium]
FSGLPVLGYAPPKDSGWIDVRELGAKGDGVTDNTPIFQNFQPKDRNDTGTFYFPDGTYLFSDTLYLGNKRVVFQGQSRDKTILRLRSRSEGFNDKDRPKPFISTHNQFMDSKSNMGQAFRNSVINLTIEVEEGNPGAVALHYLNNNQGTIENVRIRSIGRGGAGRAGLGLVTNWPGPALIREVEIEGFDFGIWSTIHQYSVTIDGLRLRGQREAGIRNSGQSLFIRGLESNNRVPAIINSDPTCAVVLVDSSLVGGDSRNTAVESWQVEPNRRWTFGAMTPALFARNVRIEGYGRGIVSQGGGETLVANGPLVREFVSRPAQRLGSDQQTSLNLPWEDPPRVELGDASGWVNVRSFASEEPPPDWGPVLQAAIDSGAEVIYFPRGRYLFRSTVVLKRPLKAIMGLGSTFHTGDWPEVDAPLFRIGPEASEVVLFDRLDDNYGKAPVRFEHSAPSTVIIKNSTIGGYRNTVPGGKVHLLDVCGDRWDFMGQSVWARQLNPEWNARKDPGGFNVKVRGGRFVVLGIKTEHGGSVIEATDGAEVEVLGGWTYHSGEIGYLNDESKMSLAGISTSSGHFRTALVREVRGGQSRDLFLQTGREEQNLDGSFRKYGTLLPLYLGW